MKAESWTKLLDADPRGWLLESGDAAARWVALAGLLDRKPDHPDRVAARASVLADPATEALIARLPDWEADNHLSGHSSPGFAPNLLNLLADMGVGAGDDRRIERLLDAMEAHQEANGRLASFGSGRAGEAPVWGALLCDSHAIAEVLVRFGRGSRPVARGALARMAADLTATAQGPAWPCIPHPISGFRGPGRIGDFCPQVTLEALRVFSFLPARQRPRQTLAAARTALRGWTARGSEKPYMFGHGVQFKTVKWPTSWYDIHALLDALGRYPALWRGSAAGSSERHALAELVACLVAYNFSPDGTVTPRACYQGFADYSFGQKKRPSAFATARLCVVLRRFDGLAAEAASIDVAGLGSSKGGSGVPQPPKGR